MNTTLKDKDYCINLLSTLKHLKSLYNIFTQEASNEEVYKVVNANYITISKLQRELYDLMSVQGWYKLTYEETKNIKKSYDKFAPSINK